MIYGIDSGKTGAIGWISNRGLFRMVMDIPQSLDFKSIPRGENVDIIIIEKVVPFLGKWKEGKRELEVNPESILTMGRQYERAMIAAQIIQKYSTCHDCKIYEVYPKNSNKENGLPGWKRHFGLDADKDKSIFFAEKLFPASKSYLYGPRGGKLHDRAEALLLAEFGRQVVFNAFPLIPVRKFKKKEFKKMYP